MNFLNTIEDLNRATEEWLFTSGPALSEQARADIIKVRTSPSPVDRIVGLGEALWANRVEIDATGMELCAQLMSFATANGWHGLASEGRGTLIVQAMTRNLKAGVAAGKWNDRPDDPEEKPEFARKAEEPADSQASPEPGVVESVS